VANDYTVGYGKTPEHTRFGKGQSGNPKGRPKGSKNFATRVQQFADEKIALKEGGKSRKVSKFDGIFLQLLNRSIAGDVRAAREVRAWLATFSDRSLGDKANHPDAEKDRSVIERFMKRSEIIRPPDDGAETLANAAELMTVTMEVPGGTVG
jgi:hypothetical protein